MQDTAGIVPDHGTILRKGSALFLGFDPSPSFLLFLLANLRRFSAKKPWSYPVFSFNILSTHFPLSHRPLLRVMELARVSSGQTSEVTALIDALKTALSANDPAGPTSRKYLKETAEKLSLALETPGETVQRIAYYVSQAP